MRKPTLTLALLSAVAGTLAACGSDASPRSSAESRLAEITAATRQSSSTSAPMSGPTIDLASVDVCALLSPADAQSAARTEMLDPFQTASTVYSFTATKQPASGGSSCEFRVVSSDGNGQGSATYRVKSAKGFAVPPNGKPITGLGNEAYDTGVAPVVRVGNVVIELVSGSFSDSFSVALLRKMVPNIK